MSELSGLAGHERPDKAAELAGNGGNCDMGPLEFPRVSLTALTALGSTLVGLVGLSAAWWGWLGGTLRWRERSLVGMGGLCFLAWAAVNRGELLGAGVLLGSLAFIGQWFRVRRSAEAAREALEKIEG